MILVIFFPTTNLNNVFKQIPEKKIIFMLACKSFFFYFLLQKFFWTLKLFILEVLIIFHIFFSLYFSTYVFKLLSKKNFEKSLKLTKLHI